MASYDDWKLQSPYQHDDDPDTEEIEAWREEAQERLHNSLESERDNAY